MEEVKGRKNMLQEPLNAYNLADIAYGIRLESSEKDELIPLLRRGDGGGADVTNLNIAQLLYSDPTLGNAVALLWTETTSNNPDGVTISVDGVVRGTVPGLADADLPGTQVIGVPQVLPGNHHFTVSGAGTTAEADHLVLDTQPFADPTGVQCRTGGRDPEDATCDMVITWSQPQVEPENISIFINGIFQIERPATLRQFTFIHVPAGSYTVELRGASTNADGTYLGTRVKTSCDIACEDMPCDAPGLLVLCQSAYGPDVDNKVRADWRNGESSYAAGIIGLVDGTAVGTISGSATIAVFGNFSPGPHTIGIQGDCGPAGESPVIEKSITLLTESPHQRPVAGEVLCAFTDGSPPTTTITWNNADPSAFIDVLLHQEPDDVYLGTIDGSSTTATVNNATPSDVFDLQFFVFAASECYGSELITCRPAGNQYIQSVCNGDGKTPQITSGIFVFNFLFIGGRTPPCIKACEANGDNVLNISDGIFILNYLFNGGRSPTLWVDTTGDAVPDPTCSTATPEECATANPACPL
jgi:hypothetical protein